MSDINTGDVVRVSTTPGFKNALGALTDPTTVRLLWRVYSNGDLTTWVYGVDAEIVRDSIGLFHADIPITEAGTHSFRWEGDGTVTAAEEGQFRSTTRF